LNSSTLAIGGSKMSEPNVRLLVETPLTMNEAASSRLPAVLNASVPRPRIGREEKPACDGATDPGTSRVRSTKCRPFSGMFWMISGETTWPSVALALSRSGTSATTVTSAATPAGCRWKS
jgi:hypothetical protein